MVVMAYGGPGALDEVEPVAERQRERAREDRAARLQRVDEDQEHREQRHQRIAGEGQMGEGGAGQADTRAAHGRYSW